MKKFLVVHFLFLLCVVARADELDGICSACPISTLVGEPVKFVAIGLGGNGSYKYSWKDRKEPEQHSTSFQTSFSTPGVKKMTVVITSGGGTVERQCRVLIISKDDKSTGYPEVGGEGTATPAKARVGETVKFVGQGKGGDTAYTYNWYQDGREVSRDKFYETSFPTPGEKTLTVTISSNGQIVSRECKVQIVASAP